MFIHPLEKSLSSEVTVRLVSPPWMFEFKRARGWLKGDPNLYYLRRDDIKQTGQANGGTGMCIRLLENNQSCHIESEGERKLILNKPHQTKLFKDWKHLSDVSDLPMGQQQRLSYSVVMDDCMKRPQETMPCQMDAKQSLVRINNTHTFAIKYDLIPLGKVSTRRKRMRHTESVYTVQPTPLYTHSQTGKRHFHFKRSMLTLTSRSKWTAETVKNSKSYITVSTKIPELENQDSTQLLLSKVKGQSSLLSFDALTERNYPNLNKFA